MTKAYRLGTVSYFQLLGHIAKIFWLFNHGIDLSVNIEWMMIRYPAVADLFFAVVSRACHQPAIDKEHKCNKDKKKYSKDGGQPVVAVHPVPL